MNPHAIHHLERKDPRFCLLLVTIAKEKKMEIGGIVIATRGLLASSIVEFQLGRLVAGLQAK